MIDEEKTFSPDFQKDMLDLLEKCIKNNTDRLTISLDYERAILDIDITFKVHRKEVEE